MMVMSRITYDDDDAGMMMTFQAFSESDLLFSLRRSWKRIEIKHAEDYSDDPPTDWSAPVLFLIAQSWPEPGRSARENEIFQFLSRSVK